MDLKKACTLFMLAKICLVAHGAQENLDEINYPTTEYQTVSQRHSLENPLKDPDCTFSSKTEVINKGEFDKKTIVQKDISLWQKCAQTIGRHKKTVLIGTFAAGTVFIAGTYYYLQWSSFDSQAFLSEYDSPLTGQTYDSFSYAGYPLPKDIMQPNWCLPNGRTLLWRGYGSEWDVHYCQQDGANYKYLDPVRNPPHSSYGKLATICNKTISDTVSFLSNQCGFNFSFWDALLKPFTNDWTAEPLNTHPPVYYCNPHPVDPTLVCARVGAHTKQIEIKDISKINLADVANFYNGARSVQARLYVGITGIALSLLSLGLLL